MKLTFSWLKEFVEVKKSVEEIAAALTMAGLELESLSPLPYERGREGDWLIEIGVTPNRGDCLGILGLGREVAALTGARLRLPPIAPHAADPGLRRVFGIKIQSPRLCPRYSARLVEGVRVGPSPVWLKSRLEACGIRSVNNVVDVTNYVMLESGQPLHGFDFDRLSTKRIVVRQAKEIRELVTLDGTERSLESEDLLICDGDRAIALAGVMGGRDSEVQEDTRSVLLESAHFDAIAVRRTAKRLGLRTEASHRFERGVDPEGTLFALDRAAFLLSEVAGGVPRKGALDAYPRRVRPAPILLRYERVKSLLGTEIKPREMEKILKSIGLKVEGRPKGAFKVLRPSWRSDLTREADLVEELARLYGYGRIPTALPLIRPQARIDPRLGWERKIRSLLIGEGLTELIHLPFTSPETNRRFRGLEGPMSGPVTVLNPLVQEGSEMRLSLMAGLLPTLRAHVEQKVKGFAGFELGKVFRLARDGQASIQERHNLGGVLFGERGRVGLKSAERPLGFLEVKGFVEAVLEALGIDGRARWGEGEGFPFLHPGKAAALEIENSTMGYLGEIHPELREGLGLPRVFLFELDFEKLLQYARREFAVRPLPRFPSVERDLAVVVDEGLPAQRIISWIKDLNHSIIEDVQVFDQYRGPSIPEGKKSLAYTISYRAEDRTLTDAEVNVLHQDLIARIAEVFGAQLR